MPEGIDFELLAASQPAPTAGKARIYFKEDELLYKKNSTDVEIQLGEYVEASVISGSAISVGNNSPTTITSLTLTEGDWDVDGNLGYLTTGAPTVTGLGSCLSLITNTLQDFYFNLFRCSTTSSSAGNIPANTRRVSVASGTTQDVFLVAFMFFTGGTTTKAFGLIRARRAKL